MIIPVRKIVGSVVLVTSLLFVAFPLGKTSWYLATDRGLRSAAPSTYAFNLQASLSSRLPGYVDERITSHVAETLSTHQVTATESPLYGAFFYLLATDNLQTQWERDRSFASQSPKETGAAAIEACVRIILDPGHATWVKNYWGEDYLDDPNCFYRMLVIGSLAAHHHLTGDASHLPLLRRLVDDLAADIDASPYGLVDDYPGQCFPADVVAGIAMIRRADPTREAWAKAAFQRVMGNFGDELPPYTANVDTGRAITLSRGCTNGFFFSYAREIDPEAAEALYQKLVERFWQQNRWAGGWREFPKGMEVSQSYFDVDSGPVLWGFGTGATGLGIGAARLHGDDARAGILGSEMIAGSIPLPDGSLLLPRLVSDMTHAPHFAETVILHQLSLSGSDTGKPGSLTGSVWLILGAEALLLAGLGRLSWKLIAAKKRVPNPGSFMKKARARERD